MISHLSALAYDVKQKPHIVETGATKWFDCTWAKNRTIHSDRSRCV